MFLANNLNKGGSLGGYQISRSLRFNQPDSAYLNRTPASAGNRTTWTWSGWIKISSTASNNGYLFTTTDANITNASYLYLSGNTIRYWDNTGAGGAGILTTTAVYRDVSAWYHIVLAVDTTQATSSNRAKLYVNGVQVTDFSTANYPSQNTNTYINDTIAHFIGAAPRYFDGYMTEVNFIDGQALTPSSFGETNADTGVWQPKAYSGSYGTNGFYLNFSDNSNTTAATLGKDYSGNGNNWTPNNFSVTAGSGNDSMVDTPTSYGTDTGVGGTVRGNYCTLNPLRNNSNYITLSNANLEATNTAVAGGSLTSSTFGLSSGKWYWEVTANTSGEVLIGVENGSASLSQYLGQNSNGWGYDSLNGQIYNGSGSVYGSTFTTNDVIGVAVDIDANKIWFAKNGTWQNSGSPTGGTNPAFSNLTSTVLPAVTCYDANSKCTFNFGQRPFAYTAPSGFKALCTQNLPTPTIGATTATQAGKYFNPVTYTATGNDPLAVTGVGFQPDFVWIKSRSAARDNVLFDAVRGATKYLVSNSTAAEATNTSSLKSFDSDGFTLGSWPPTNWVAGDTQVSWNWKANGSGSTNTAGSITSTVSANTTSGFSVVTYTGTGANATVGHGLGVAPKMYIVKCRSNADFWAVWHTSIYALNPDNYLGLNFTSAASAYSGVFTNVAPTSTTFAIGTDTSTNTSTRTYVAYCFAEVAGYSKFGSYTGNGSSDGPFVYTGFRPAFVMTKRTDSSSEWTITDLRRPGYNLVNKSLYANQSSAELTYNVLDQVSNGFKLRDPDGIWNGSGGTYIYMAFAENPFKYSLAR